QLPGGTAGDAHAGADDAAAHTQLRQQETQHRGARQCGHGMRLVCADHFADRTAQIVPRQPARGEGALAFLQGAQVIHGVFSRSCDAEACWKRSTCPRNSSPSARSSMRVAGKLAWWMARLIAAQITVTRTRCNTTSKPSAMPMEPVAFMKAQPISATAHAHSETENATSATLPRNTTAALARNTRTSLASKAASAVATRRSACTRSAPAVNTAPNAGPGSAPLLRAEASSARSSVSTPTMSSWFAQFTRSPARAEQPAEQPAGRQRDRHRLHRFLAHEVAHVVHRVIGAFARTRSEF